MFERTKWENQIVKRDGKVYRLDPQYRPVPVELVPSGWSDPDVHVRTGIGTYSNSRLPVATVSLPDHDVEGIAEYHQSGKGTKKWLEEKSGKS